jgi:hypothetical protein
MQYGPVAPKKFPKQDAARVQKLAFRWQRAAQAQQTWAEQAKECVDFLEGRQWSKDDIAALDAAGRPHLKFNKISPLVRLVAGYHRNNRMDMTAIPGHEGDSNEDVARTLTKILKQVSNLTELPYVDAEVFLDGITTGRGFYDDRLDFNNNDLGEIKSQAVDPFTVYMDADGDQYDLNKCNIVQVSKWLSIEDVTASYGKQAADLVSGFINGQNWNMFPVYGTEDSQEIHPVRKFGMEEDEMMGEWSAFHGLFMDHFVDRAHKNIRCIDSQYWETEVANVFIDLETGDKSVIPKTWKEERIQKALYYAQQVGNPLIVQKRPVRRVRWTVVIGDLIVSDSWSPYDRFTLNLFAPYHRRGHTMGMVEDLIDPQKEINKRRSNQIEIVGRSTNSGWQFHQDAVTPDQKKNLQQNSSAPGFLFEHKGEGDKKPVPINNSPNLTAQKLLEDSSVKDLKEISGINDAALGQLDRAAISGKAMESRQRQTMVGLQMYMDNFKRTKILQGKKQIAIIQKHYTEQRIIRIQGEKDKPAEQVVLNQQVVDETTGAIKEILNNVTIGKYSIMVDETPLSASFKEAQFEELTQIFEMLGPNISGFLAQTSPEIILEMSSIPNKQEFIEGLKKASEMAAEQEAQGGAQQQGGAG